MKKVIIAGGSGFLGNAITSYFQLKGYYITHLVRNNLGNATDVNKINWDAKTIGDWALVLEGAEVLINLCGKSVDCRYTAANKNQILSSRLDSTRALNHACALCVNPPKVWVNASSATIYSHSINVAHTEQSNVLAGNFSEEVCVAWEQEFFKIEIENTRKVALRMAIVLGNSGGAFPQLKQLAKFGLGGKQGSGQQMMSWIHLTDLSRVIDFIVDNPHILGVVNAAAPNPLTNAELMKIIRTNMGRKIGFPIPEILLKFGAILIGTETELILKSRNVVSERMHTEGFSFCYPTAESAIHQLIG